MSRPDAPSPSPRSRVLARLRGGEEGIALVLVVGSMLVLAMLAMTALAYTMSSQKFARYDQDFSAAMTAAQSGVEDFISRLNRNDAYGTTPDCTNPAFKGPMTVPNTCGWGTTTTAGWLPVVPGTTDPTAAWFHYAIDASRASTDGTIMVTSTGRVNGRYRTIETSVRKGGSTDYVYYTDFESSDPANVQAYPPSGATVAACGAGGYANARYWYDKPGLPGRNQLPSSGDCVEPTFQSSDVLAGRVFTNDAILSSGAHFMKKVESANPDCGTVTASTSTWNNCLRDGSTANFHGNRPALADPLYLTDNSAEFANHPGCHYFGATRIILNNDGTMRVWNKTSNNNNQAPIAIAAPGGTAPTCGTVAQLNDVNGVQVPVPHEGVVYVAASSATKRQCYGGEIGGPSGRTLPLGTYASTTPATPAWNTPSYTADTNMSEVTKYCGEGNLYLEGTLYGRVTFASQQSIVVTGDLVLARGLQVNKDMMGLVATNSVEVFHPRVGTVSPTKVNPSCSSNCAYKWAAPTGVADASGWPTRYNDPSLTPAAKNPASGLMIAASIQTLQHSFLVQKYFEGAGNLTLSVRGSIAQRWRGAVGISGGSHGYYKDYVWDTRLQFSSPPYFPKWANSQWSLRYSGEINTPNNIRN